MDSEGSPIFKQTRVGKHNKDFTLFKFRTMYVSGSSGTAITLSNRDPRITRIGFILRKYKLDELPQLFNVFFGDMSFVGPRPELRSFVSKYNEVQLKVLNVKPGITDYASIKYFNESEILGRSQNPEYDYIHQIMPEKLKLNLEYISNNSTYKDLKIILLTIKKIFFH